GVTPEIDKERCALSYRTADIADVLLKEERGLFLRIRISRIPKIVRNIESFGAVELVRSRFRQYFDPSCADLVVFRRKWILIDVNLANGFLRRHLAIRKSIDEQRSPAGPGARAGNRDKLGDEILRIIRQGFQIVAG